MTWIFSVIGSYWHCTYGCRMSFCCPWGCGSTRPHSYTPLTWGRWCSCWQGRDNRVCSLAAIYRSQVYILKKRKEYFNCMVKWTLGIIIPFFIPPFLIWQITKVQKSSLNDSTLRKKFCLVSNSKARINHTSVINSFIDVTVYQI